MRIIKSENILVSCSTGVLLMNEGNAIIEVEDCTNISVSNIKSFFDLTRNHKEWYLIKETFNGKTYTVKADEDVKLSLFLREEK